MSDVDKAVELARYTVNRGACCVDGEHSCIYQEAYDLARALLAVIAERDAMAKVCEAAVAFGPKVDSLRMQFGPPDCWFANATCGARVEFTVSQWNKLEALRKALAEYSALRATRKATP